MTSLALGLKLSAIKTLSAVQRAVAAIRRNNGTLILPGAATPVLGAELVTNGDFSNGTTGWTRGNTGTQTIESGALRVAGDGTTTWSGVSESTIPALTRGKQYLVQFSVLAENTSSGAGLYFRTTSMSIGGLFTNGLDYFYPGAVGNYSILFTATVDNITQLRIIAGNEANASVLFDNISVKEILSYTHGNPALRNYLDSAGTDILDSVTQVDQPVGLCLDSMGVLGAELVTASTLLLNATVSNGGVLPYTQTATANANYSAYSNVLTVGKWYQATASWTGNTNNRWVFLESAPLSNATSGTVTLTFKATVAAAALGVLDGLIGESITVTALSVREIPGSHASQPTTDSKPILRRGLVNLLTQSDFQNGVTDAPARGGLVTASTLSGYGGALAFGHDGSATSYGYKLFAATLNAAYTLAVVVKMDDGNAPVFGNSINQDASNSFAIVLYSNAYSPIGAGGYTITALADNTYLVLCSAVATTAGPRYFGVVKYPASNRTFKVTRYGLFQGTVTASQILAAGGIPLTTTPPASSSKGNYWWQWDGSNDSFSTSITTGNEGWVCAGVTQNAAANVSVAGNGASGASAGIAMLVRATGAVWGNKSNGSTEVTTVVAGNGSVVAGVPFVYSFGWNATTNLGSFNNTEVTQAAAISATSANVLKIGEKGNSTEYWNGSMSATVYCPTLPSAADRALIRRFVGSLQGQTL